eukprot:scaffold260837_cov36-Tisochrysis_lutea.AAC.2
MAAPPRQLVYAKVADRHLLGTEECQQVHELRRGVGAGGETSRHSATTEATTEANGPKLQAAVSDEHLMMVAMPGQRCKAGHVTNWRTSIKDPCGETTLQTAQVDRAS